MAYWQNLGKSIKADQKDKLNLFFQERAVWSINGDQQHEPATIPRSQVEILFIIRSQVEILFFLYIFRNCV